MVQRTRSLCSLNRFYFRFIGTEVDLETSFHVFQGDGSRTSITVDFGDGNAFTYSNVSSIEDGIKHIYKNVGIYRVSATAENRLGSETVLLFLHVTCKSGFGRESIDIPNADGNYMFCLFVLNVFKERAGPELIYGLLTRKISFGLGRIVLDINRPRLQAHGLQLDQEIEIILLSYCRQTLQCTL